MKIQERVTEVTMYNIDEWIDTLHFASIHSSKFFPTFHWKYSHES